jgi:hypothetical protein
VVGVGLKMFRLSHLLRQRGFFVDANLMILYGRGFDKDLTSFVNDQNHRFFFTETVGAELENTQRLHEIPAPFKLVHSKIPDLKKKEAIEFFYETWNLHYSKFPKRKNYTEFSPEQLAKFKDDLTIVMEAGYSQYDLEDINIRSLITSNLKLYNKFFIREDARDILEETINLNGLEHLVEVNPIDEILDKWRRQRNAQ